MRDGACPLEQEKGIINSTYTEWYQEKPKTSKFHWVKQANRRGNIVFFLSSTKMWILYIKSKRFQIANGWKNNRRCHFLKGPVSQLRLAQLVAELDNSLGLIMSGAVYDAEVQFHNCTLYLINGKQNLGEVRSGVASTKTGIKDGFDEEEHAFLSGTFFFRWSRFSGLESFP